MTSEETVTPERMNASSTRLGAVPVAFYAGVFFLVNVTYVLLGGRGQVRTAKVDARARSTMRMRSFATLAISAAAGLVGLGYPLGGMAMICLWPHRLREPGAPASHVNPSCLSNLNRICFW